MHGKLWIFGDITNLKITKFVNSPEISLASQWEEKKMRLIHLVYGQAGTLSNGWRSWFHPKTFPHLIVIILIVLVRVVERNFTFGTLITRNSSVQSREKHSPFCCFSLLIRPSAVKAVFSQPTDLHGNLFQKHYHAHTRKCFTDCPSIP